MKLIGLCGVSGVGKDTIADHLVSKHSFVKVGIADPLKRFMAEVLGVPNTQLWGPSQARDGRFRGVRIRDTLNALGETVRRASGGYALIDQARRTAERLQVGGYCYIQEFGLIKTPTLPKDVVITDARFELETQEIVKAGGEIWGVTRPLKTLPINEQHCQRIIRNNYDFDYLQWDIDRMLERYGAH